MSKRFRPCDLNQPYLLPPSLEDWLPEHHLARFIAQIVDELDLSRIYARYQRKDGRGLAAYHPLMMTRLLLYAYAIGITSSRRIEKATYDDLALRYLATDQHPDHDTIAAFRQEHLEELAKLFVQALQLCRRAGMVKLGNVAIDGTKIRANAGRRAYRYAELQEQERQLQEMVDRLLREAAQTDSEEDARWGKGRSDDRLPAELATAQGRLEKIRQAKRELEEEAQQRLGQARHDYPGSGKPGSPQQGKGAREECSPQAYEKLKKRLWRARREAREPRRLYHFTDPDCRMMKDKGLQRLVHGYNAQLAVDGEAQVIVGAEVSQEAADGGLLLPMVDQVRKTLGEAPRVVTADAGYWDTTSINDPSLAGIETLVTPDAMHGARRKSQHKHNPTVERMRKLLRQPRERSLYGMRKTIVEPVFGQIKQIRGFRQFTLRGLAKVQAEWKLICLTHNLLKLYRHRWLPQLA